MASVMRLPAACMPQNVPVSGYSQKHHSVQELRTTCKHKGLDTDQWRASHFPPSQPCSQQRFNNFGAQGVLFCVQTLCCIHSDVKNPASHRPRGRERARRNSQEALLLLLLMRDCTRLLRRAMCALRDLRKRSYQLSVFVDTPAKGDSLYRWIFDICRQITAERTDRSERSRLTERALRASCRPLSAATSARCRRHPGAQPSRYLR